VAGAGAAAARARRVPAPPPRRDEWPDWSDKELLATLDEWLAPYLVRFTGAADLARLDTEMLLSSQLGWDGSTRLAELAPSHLDTPAGRTAVIDYSRDIPTASVRVQDLFGLREHPTVAGAVPVALELLSPADRPIQITSDLPGFWAGTWADVRKEMAGRYPKHQWPTDPATATPQTPQVATRPATWPR
jgi:ATP-dependent helicase HrpB